jgi:hypothetical protein
MMGGAWVLERLWAEVFGRTATSVRTAETVGVT